MEYIDQKAWIRGIGAGVAVGGGMSVVSESLLGILVGILFAVTVIVGNYVRNRNKAAS